MWGTIAGAGLSALGSIVGGAMASDEAEENAARMRKIFAKRKQDNENWYNKNYNEDPTQRADAQRILQITENNIRKRNKAAAGRAAMMGGGDEQTAREKEANNELYANAVGQIAAQNEQRKQAIDAQYRNRKDALEDAEMGMEDALSRSRQQQIGSSIQGIIGAGSAIAGLFDSTSKKKA